MPDREAFLSEADSIPGGKPYREILGYAWERLIQEQDVATSLHYVWPDAPVPEVGTNAPVVGTLSTRDVVRRWRGAFLANGLEPWAFLYPGWDEQRRRRFRQHCNRHGWTHLPICWWGYYEESGDPPYDFRRDVDGFRRIISELLADGLIPVVFAVTDQFKGDRDWTAREAITHAASYLPQIADLTPAVCLGWELNMVAGWYEKGQNGNTRQGQDMLELAETIRKAVPHALVYAHWQERWWGPHYSEGIEATWWHDAKGLVDGYLHNDWSSREQDTLHYLLQLPSPNGWGPGVCGRVQALGFDVIAFEIARDPARHQRLVAAIEQDGRCRGYC